MYFDCRRNLALQVRDLYNHVHIEIHLDLHIVPGMNLSGIASQFPMQNRSFAMRN